LRVLDIGSIGGGRFHDEIAMPLSEYTMNIFYIIGVIVVVLFVAGFFGLHAWTIGTRFSFTGWNWVLLGGLSGRFGGYGYGHSGIGIVGVILIILVVLLLMGRLWSCQSPRAAR
jgi:Protein of unknown function (DUF3309)